MNTLLLSLRGWRASRPRKEIRKKEQGSEKSEEKSYRGTEDWEKRRENKGRNSDRGSNQATLDHSVASCDPHGSLGEPILVPPLPIHRGDLIRTSVCNLLVLDKRPFYTWGVSFLIT